MGWNTLRVLDVLGRWPVASLVADAQGRVAQANAAVLALLGWRHPPLLLAEWRVADRRADELRCRALARVRSWLGEANWRTGHGRTLLVWESAWRVDTAEGVYDVHMLESLATMKRMRRVTALAFYDSLTGLPNRNLLADRIAMAMERSRRSGRAFALFYLDLDGMKAVNDTAGHAAGDRLLRAVAQAIRRAVRRRDTVARLSGDEFIVLAEDVAYAAAWVPVSLVPQPDGATLPFPHFYERGKPGYLRFLPPMAAQTRRALLASGRDDLLELVAARNAAFGGGAP